MNNYPLIKFVLLFICGFIIQSILKLNSIILFYLSAVSILFLILLYFVKKENYSLIRFIILSFSVIVISAFYYSSVSNSKVAYPFHLPKYQNVKVIGRITDIDLMKENRINFYFAADSIFLPGLNYKSKINFLCSIKESKKKLKQIYDSLKIGNKVELIGSIIKPRDKRNIGEFDFENYLANRQIHALLNVDNILNIKIISKQSDAILNFIFIVRKKIDEIIASYHNKSTAALLRGLILADRSLIDYEIKNEFINAGVIHVLAVSGLHVGFIALIFVFLFQRLNIYARYLFTIFGLLLFMLITNAPPSVTRATTMAIAMLLSPLTSRKYNSINAIVLSAFIILLINPNELFNPGFQLSFAAVLSIILFYPPLRNIIIKLNIKSKIITYILLFSVVSIAAQIGTLPFVLFYFHKLSIIALIANIIVIPLIAIIIGLGLFTLFIQFISSSIAFYYATANEALAYILFMITNRLGNLTLAFIPINQFSLFDSIIFYFILTFTFCNWKKLTTWLSKTIVIILIPLLTFSWLNIDNNDYMPNNVLSVMAIDVGQGDSFLIKFPNGKTALIDAGNADKYFDNGKRIIEPLLLNLGIEKVDYGFISHIDSDHYRGFLSLIKDKKVKVIYKPKLDSTNKNDIELEKLLNAYSIPYKYYSKEIMKIGNVRFYILNDTSNYYYKSLSSNDKSGVFKIVYGNNSFLFTGDAGIKTEKYLINRYGKFLDSDILKAGHHGSRTSTSEPFLNSVRPKYAIISAGVANRFHHPHKEVLVRLLKRKIKSFRTDKSGAILLQSDGYKIQNINWKRLDNSFIF